MQNVKFRKFPEGDIIALFPDEPDNHRGDITSYQHVGQHGAASPELVADLEHATPEEYAPLLKELEDAGYDLRVEYRGFYFTINEHIENMTDDELIREVERAEDIFADMEGSGQGISTKETIRHRFSVLEQRRREAGIGLNMSIADFAGMARLFAPREAD